MDIVIIFLIVTFLFLLSGFPVAFILSGISLLFGFIGILFGFFDYSYLMAFPARLFVVYESTSMITRSWVMLEGSSEPGGLPIVFILKSSIYLFSFLIFIQAVNKIFNKR